MLVLPTKVGLAGLPTYRANAVVFDGTNDYATRGAGLTGAVDSRYLLMSFWFMLNGGDGADQRIFADNAAQTLLSRRSTNKLEGSVYNAAATSIFSFVTTSATYVADATWHHLLLKMNTNAGAGSKVCQLYVDDASVAVTLTDTAAAFDIDFTMTNFAIGALTGGTGKINMSLADFYVAMGTDLDLSVSANRRMFRSAGGKPVNPLSSGAPTPIIFQNNNAANWATNAGTGGNFTVTGTLTDAPTSPSD